MKSRTAGGGQVRQRSITRFSLVQASAARARRSERSEVRSKADEPSRRREGVDCARRAAVRVSTASREPGIRPAYHCRSFSRKGVVNGASRVALSDLVIKQGSRPASPKSFNMLASKCLLQLHTCKVGSKHLRTESGGRGRNNKIVKKWYRGIILGERSLRRTVGPAGSPSDKVGRLLQRVRRRRSHGSSGGGVLLIRIDGRVIPRRVIRTPAVLLMIRSPTRRSSRRCDVERAPSCRLLLLLIERPPR